MFGYFLEDRDRHRRQRQHLHLRPQQRLRRLPQRVQPRRRQRHQDLLLLQGVPQCRGLARLRIQDPESRLPRRSLARRRSDRVAHASRVLGFSVCRRRELFTHLLSGSAFCADRKVRDREDALASMRQARFVRHPERDRAPDVGQNLHFNSVTKDFADNSRQGCCSG